MHLLQNSTVLKFPKLKLKGKSCLLGICNYCVLIVYNILKH
jgi:hypothetical protein